MSRIDCWHWKISTGHYFQNGHHNIAKIQHCPISSKFDMWVDNDVLNWFTMLIFCDIVVAILKMATVRKFSMLGINSWHHYLPTYQILKISDNVQFLRYCGGHIKFSNSRHFQNGHHNIAKNQHCPIPSQFDMWVDNDVPNWFPTLNNYYWSWTS
jgi:hypothetical protein